MKEKGTAKAGWLGKERERERDLILLVLILGIESYLHYSSKIFRAALVHKNEEIQFGISDNLSKAASPMDRKS